MFHWTNWICDTGKKELVFYRIHLEVNYWLDCQQFIFWEVVLYQWCGKKSNFWHDTNIKIIVDSSITFIQQQSYKVGSFFIPIWRWGNWVTQVIIWPYYTTGAWGSQYLNPDTVWLHSLLSLYGVLSLLQIDPLYLPRAVKICFRSQQEEPCPGW